MLRTIAALGSRLQRSTALARGPSRPAARACVDALPVAAVLAEAGPRRGGLWLLASNRLAQQLLGAPALALRASGRGYQWLFPDLTPCADEDMPLQRAARHGDPTHGQILLLRDARGRLQPLAVSARRIPGGGLARAIALFEAAPAWQGDESAETLLAGFNEAQTHRAHYRQLFDAAPVALLASDEGGIIVEANDEAGALLGAAAPLTGAPLADRLAEEAAPALQEALEALRQGAAGRARLRLRGQPGREVEAHAWRVGDEDTPLVVWALHDVSGMAEAERQRRDYTDLLLHDLRSPLATALLGIETAGRAIQRDDGERAGRALATAQAALRRLNRLVDSLLDISRLEVGQSTLQPAPLKMEELLVEVAREAELLLAAHELTLQVGVEPGLPEITADRDVAYRAVFALLDNAIKFSPAQGRIWLHAAAQDGGVAVTVVDQGPGIPAELRPRIFDKFVGLHLPQAPRGYGLGLAFCKLAMEAHGGRVAVDSAPGRGSAFTLWLPVGQDV
ncbi:MAG TPA: ATP-binding protein [Anaerolineae bacterium]|nr:ATP-binding protein [Anaerolineae bacterium]